MTYDKIDIGNVRGIKGEKGDKGDRGKTPSYEDIKYQKQNENYVTILTDKPISQTQYYLDANRRLCNSEGYLLDDQMNPTQTKGVPYDETIYGYKYEPLYVDSDNRYTNSKGELLDENFNPKYQETSFLHDILSYLYMDDRIWDALVSDVYPNVVEELLSTKHYYVCNDNPRDTIYINNNEELINTCSYFDENGDVVEDGNNNEVPVPLTKNTLYLYNPSGAIDNDVMHYDIYLCTRDDTVPIKLVSANDFVIRYNIIDDIAIKKQYNGTRLENDVYLRTKFKGTGRFYTREEVDTLFEDNLIDKLGANGGIAQLNNSGKVPNSQLPSYVDDVIEGTMNNAETTFTPSDNNYIGSVKESGKIYVDVNTKKTYRWSGSAYVFISNPITVSDGSNSAYAASSGSALETKIGNSTLTTTSNTLTGAINELDTEVSGKSDVGHKHPISDVNNLQNTLNGLATTTYVDSQIASVSGDISSIDLSSKADAVHTHTISDVTNLQTTLDGKVSGAGTGLTKDGSNIKHNDNVSNAQTSLALKKIKFDKQGHITGVDDVGASDLPSGISTSKISGLSTVATTNSYNDLDNKPTIPDKTSQLTNNSGFITDVSGKLDKSQTSHMGKNVVVNASSGIIDFEDKNNHTHPISSVTNLQSTLDGKVSGAGTGLTKDGSNIKHNDNVSNAQTTSALVKITFDKQGHITGTSSVDGSDLPTNIPMSSVTSLQSAITSMYNSYLKNSLRIKVGRWSDSQGEDGTKIEFDVGNSGNAIYAKLYCDDPDWSLNNRTVVFSLNGKPYERTTDSTGKTAKLDINFTELGDYLLTALIRGDNNMNPTSEAKIIRMKSG